MDVAIKIQEYARVIHALHEKWMPHSGQIPIGQAVFIDGLDDIFLECGRNFGKTEFLDYLYWRVALTRPNTKNYLIYPFKKQGREVVWESNRIQFFGPDYFISSTNDTDMRINFINGSFVKIDGSDNVEAYRGVKIRGGGIWGYDEYKDHKPEFHDAVEPNLLECILIRVGTPPYGDNHFTIAADEVKKNPTGAYFNRTYLDNPHIPHEKLLKVKKRLYSLGEGYKWECEYMAKRVKGGPGHLIPMAPHYKLRPYDEVMKEISRDLHKLEFYEMNDPGTATVHATLFAAVNPYTKKVYLLDEIYESDTRKTSVTLLGPRIHEKRTAIQPDLERWDLGYDEAASWFENEMYNQAHLWMPPGVELNYVPTEKSKMKKEDGLSLIKDLFLHDILVITDRCFKTKWEMDNYHKDEKGNIPKKNDHAIDDLRYLLHAAGYEFNPEEPPIPEEDRPERGFTMEDDFPEYVDDYAEFDID